MFQKLARTCTTGGSLLSVCTAANRYYARSKRTGKEAAVKVVPVSDCSTTEVDKEAELHRRSHHPNIVAYYWHAQWRNKLWIRMELMTGGTLKDLRCVHLSRVLDTCVAHDPLCFKLLMSVFIYSKSCVGF